MNPKITDLGVSGLPVTEGRAKLLEEIMATARIESDLRNAAPEPPRRSRWLPVAGAAAAVAAVATGAVWLGSQYDDPEPRDAPAGTTPEPGELAVLEADGWRLDDASQDEHGGELEYHRGCDLANPRCTDGQELTITWTPLEPFDLYAEDPIEVDGEQIGERLEVLERRAMLFHYSGDHLAMVEVLGDYFVEVRGEGMGEASFRDLLGLLQPVAAGDLDARLPERFISDDERSAVIAEMLAPLPLPSGFDPAAVQAAEWQRYDLGAEVVAPVVCAWVEQFREARQAGDTAAQEEAQDALATAREWPVLQEMRTEGGYPDVVWEIADEVVGGRVPVEYRHGLGCSRG